MTSGDVPPCMTRIVVVGCLSRQHFLYFCPLPQGHGSFLPTLPVPITYFRLGLFRQRSYPHVAVFLSGIAVQNLFDLSSRYHVADTDIGRVTDEPLLSAQI